MNFTRYGKTNEDCRIRTYALIRGNALQVNRLYHSAMSYDNLRKFYYKINDKKNVRAVTIKPSIPSPRAFISIEEHLYR